MGHLLEKSALILVDLQNDFCNGGALAVPGGDDVMTIANALQPHFNLIIATQDWHPHDHMSFAANHQSAGVGDHLSIDGIDQTLWPVHCVQESVGADFHHALNFSRIHHVVHKGTDKVVDSYSAFFDNAHKRSTGLHDLLQSSGITHIFMMGLATDYCVKYSVLDALALGYTVTVIEDGCRGVGLNPNDIPDAIATMQNAGAEWISYNQFINSMGSFK